MLVIAGFYPVSMRSRRVPIALCSVAAFGGLAGVIAGCGGDSVAYSVPTAPPALTAPPSGGTPAPAGSSQRRAMREAVRGVRGASRRANVPIYRL